MRHVCRISEMAGLKVPQTLNIYDRMRHAINTGQPYHTVLCPPPADPRCSHPPREKELNLGTRPFPSMAFKTRVAKLRWSSVRSDRSACKSEVTNRVMGRRRARAGGQGLHCPCQ